MSQALVPTAEPQNLLQTSAAVEAGDLAMSQAPADLQNFLQQLQRSGQGSPSAPAADALSPQGQPAANQWAYIAYLMQQQQQQQHQQQQAAQQHRIAPPDLATMLAAVAADPAAAQQLGPILAAMLHKAAGQGADGDGKNGSGEAVGAFGASDVGASSSKEGLLDPSSILPLLQLQCVAAFVCRRLCIIDIHPPGHALPVQAEHQGI